MRPQLQDPSTGGLGPSDFVFVLGMHRSGTSCLAGALERSGLNLGNVRRTGRFNRRGYYEIQAVERLHERILATSDGSWYRPPRQLRIQPELQQELQGVVRQLECSAPCGIKDPRLLLLLEFWLDLVTLPAVFVGTFRHPLAVARSLNRFHGFGIEQGLALWLDYNSRLVGYHTEQPFSLVEYDLSDAEGYCRKVSALAVRIGLEPRLSHLRRFVSSKLEHFPAGAPVPEACRATYSYLRDNRLLDTESELIRQASGGLSRWLGGAAGHASGSLRELLFRSRHRIRDGLRSLIRPTR